MRVFALSDLHLSFMVEKPMDIFGGDWENHTEKLAENWQSTVGKDDLVLIGGDISWAMRIEETKKDFEYIEKLNGKKVIIRGNHEYWWKSISGVREILPPSVVALQNDCVRYGDIIVAGTRGWDIPQYEGDPRFTTEDKKIYDRELIRLEIALEAVKKIRKEGDKVFYMIHYPPFNAKREDSDFTRMFEKYQVDKVIYGHLHKSAGKYPLVMNKNGIEYYLTSADLVGMKPVLLQD